MSKPPQRGKLRNPPKARQYTFIALGVVVLLAIGSFAFLYTTHSYGVFPVTSSTSTTSGGSSGTFAVITTNLGPIEVQLFPAAAPKTVANFVNLTNSGFYNNLVWHRIVKDFVIQTGDPNTKNGGGDRSTWGTGGSPQTVPLEINSTLHNAAGYLGMARSSSPNSGSSQFYINLKDNNATLDGQYTVFGKVISGMDVVQNLGSVPVNSNSQPVDATKATVVSITIRTTP